MTRRRSAASLPSYRAVPRRERLDATHHAIVSAAVHAFRVRGYSATTMPTIAAIAGVSPRTLYRHFGSKSALFAATVAEATTEFLQRLSTQIHKTPLREAILVAFERTNIEMNEESREMMQVASVDEDVWRYFQAATSGMQPALVATLRSATASQAAVVPDDGLIWDVRAGALLAAMSTAYRRWAATPGSELLELVASAIDTVLPIVTPPTHDGVDRIEE
jgi:AcrR family transcriptional regulator